MQTAYLIRFVGSRRTSLEGRNRQRGIAALSLAALTVLFCAMLLAGGLLPRSGSASASVEDQMKSMDWAQNAISSFIATRGRTPCAASERGGEEDCALKGKGWLPLKTLQSITSTAGYASNPDTRYAAYRGAAITPDDPDLAADSDGFIPTVADGSPLPDYPTVVGGGRHLWEITGIVSPPCRGGTMGYKCRHGWRRNFNQGPYSQPERRSRYVECCIRSFSFSSW